MNEDRMKSNKDDPNDSDEFMQGEITSSNKSL